MAKTHNYTQAAYNIIFITVLFVLFVMPIPFGSRPDWAWPYFSFLIMVCAGLMYWLEENRVIESMVRYKKAHALFALWLMLIAFQLLELPIFLVEILSPRKVEALADVSSASNGRVNVGGYVSITMDYSSTFNMFLLSMSYYAIFVLVSIFAQDMKYRVIIIYCLLASALLQSLYGVYMTLSGEEKILFYEKVKGGGATGTFTNQNHYAGYLVMSVFLALGLMLSKFKSGFSSMGKQKNKLKGLLLLLFSEKVLLRVVIIILVIGLIMSKSRMGNFTFIIALMVISIVAWFRHIGNRKIIAFVLLSVIVLDTAIIGAWFGLDKVTQRFVEMVKIEESVQNDSGGGGNDELSYVVRKSNNQFNEGRLIVYESMFPYIQDYIVAGSGLGSFVNVYPRYRPENIHVKYNYAHNEYLQLLAEMGVVGFILLGSLIVMTLYTLLANVKRENNYHHAILSLALFAAISAVMLHALVEFSLRIPAFTVTFIALLALANVISMESKDKVAEAYGVGK